MILFFKYQNFPILCHVSFTILSEQFSQNNFPIKTKPFKVTKYNGGYLLFYICYKKIGTKIHITNTHNIQIKQTVLYFQVQ